MTVDARVFTADELLRLPDDGNRYELVQGELRTMSPAGIRHGRICARISNSLGPHVQRHGLGETYIAEAGFVLRRGPDTVRVPDIAFVRAERVIDVEGFMPGAPDLAIEVISPSDSFSEVAAKTREYLSAGTRAVITVDPANRMVHVHRASGSMLVDDVLEIDDVVPGWKLPLADIFAV